MHSLRTILTIPLLAGALALTGAPISAQESKAGGISIVQPWIRATPTAAKTAAGYLKVTNNGKEADALVSATVDGAEATEIHEMAMKDNVMTMRRLDKGADVKPGETLELKPGGFHLMMIGLKAPYRKGESVKATLTFAKAGTVAVEFKVEGPRGPSGHTGH